MKYGTRILLITLVFTFSALSVYAQNWRDLQTFEPDPFEINVYEWFGECLDMDGQYAVVGARTYMDKKGCAYVLKYESGIWTAIARLTASDGNDVDYLGAAVAIDGNTIVLTASTPGKVYLYEMPAGGWEDMTETLQLTPQDAFGSNFGTAVDIENDLIAISDPGTGNGKVFLFEKTGANWTSDPEIAVLSPVNGSTSYGFGADISIHGDLIAVGEPSHDKGYVYLFYKPVAGWTDMAPADTLSFSGPLTNSTLGRSIDVCDEYIVAGSDKSAAVFEKPTGGWESMTETAILSGSVAGNDTGLGYDVAAEDNTIVLANVYYDSEGISNRGGLFFYERSGDHWTNMTETFVQTASDSEEGDELGSDVVMQGDTVLAGAKRNDYSGPGAGAAYAFARTGTNWSDGTTEQLILPKPSLKTDNAWFGASVAIDGNTAVVGIPGYQNDEGAVRVLEWNGSQWEKVALLTPDEPQKGAQFGYAVDIHQDTIIVGSPYYDWPDPASEDMGLAYLFVKQGAEWTDMNQRAIFYDNLFQSNQEFGFSVAWDKGRAVVGAPKWDKIEGTTTENVGILYIYHKPDLSEPLNTAFSTNSHLFTSDGDADHMLGKAVCIQDNVIMASATGANSNIGAVYVFENRGPVYNNVETAILTPSDGSSGDSFGDDVDTDGTNIIVGAGQKDSPEYNTGGAYIFVKNTNWTTTTETAIITPSITFDKTWGESVAIDGSIALISGHGVQNVLVYEAADWSSPVEKNVINIVNSFSGGMRPPAVGLDNTTAIIGYQGYNGTNGDYAGMATVFERFSPPTSQASELTVSSSASSEINISWTAGNGEGQLVFMKADGTGSPTLTDNTNYTANTEYGGGTEVDGWYCVFNGSATATEVDVTGLSPETTYRISVYSYNGEDGSNLILQDNATNNPVNFTTGIDLDGVGYHVANGQLTSTTTGMEYEIAGSGTWTACSDGTTEGVVFAEGTVIVRQASDVGNTYTVADLSAPSAPAFSLDYESETTAETVGATIEYNTDNNFSTANTAGTGVAVTVVPGTDLYFRYKATETDLPSVVQTLVVPNRPAAPAYTIDYEAETTTEAVPTTVEYAEDSGFTTGTGTGGNTPLALSPGTDLWFRTAASNSEENFHGQSVQLTVPSRPAAPAYGIDYEAETTLEVIPDTIEYAADAGFTTGLTTGSGAVLSLTPNTNTWFRYKASNTHEFFTSEAQQLTTPARPSAPAYTIDYAAETTVENVPATVEYAEDSGFTTALQSGDGNPAALTPGTNVWFRTKASDTEQNFAGTAQALGVPARPDPVAYTIYYAAERTWEGAFSYTQWAEDANFTVNVQTGTGSVIYLTPGTSLYIRQLARPHLNRFKSEAFFLEVPERPDSPVFTIDFENETTHEPVPSTVFYSSFFGGSDGMGTTINLNPSYDVTFRVSASEANQHFASEEFVLEVPERPAVPAFEIDFINEQTTEIVPDTVEYRINYSPTIIQGEGNALSLDPGTTVLLRYKATSTHFRSMEQTLSVPARPQAPDFSINYILEETNESIPATAEYSDNEGVSFTQGDGSKLTIIPGTDYLFRYAATASQFHSAGQSYPAPERPAAPTGPVVDDEADTFDWTLLGSWPNFNSYEFSTDAGSSWGTCQTKPLQIGNVNLSAGEVQVRVAASNSYGSERFTGLSLASDADFTQSTGILSPETSELILYPNPVSETVRFRLQEEVLLSSVRILSPTGNVLMHRTDIYSSESLDVSTFSPGMYIVEIQYKDQLIRRTMMKN